MSGAATLMTVLWITLWITSGSTVDRIHSTPVDLGKQRHVHLVDNQRQRVETMSARMIPLNPMARFQLGWFSRNETGTKLPMR